MDNPDKVSAEDCAVIRRYNERYSDSRGGMDRLLDIPYLIKLMVRQVMNGNVL